MKEFTKEMLQKLEAANEEVKGTCDYTKFHMPCESKRNGRWHFICWTIPHTTGKIKTFKDKTYIITEHGISSDKYLGRYAVNEEVKELLGI